MKGLIVLAHPDDELLFGWPVLFDDTIEKELLVCSSDENNPARRWCAGRRAALAEVCEELGVRHECLPYSSDFYRLQTRPTNELLEFCEHVRDRVARSSRDFVFTHNPHGEYGHGDHRLLFSLVAETVAPGHLVFSDMHIVADWPLSKQRESAAYRRFYAAPFGEPCVMSAVQRAKFDQCKAIYRRHSCWTWAKEVVTECRLYRI